MQSNRPERVLITGGAGFIGSHTVDLLLKQGRQVIVLDNLSSGKLENLDLRHPDLDFVEGDILEFPLVAKLISDVDAVIHLAAIASVPMSIEYPIYTFQVNTQGFLHVLEGVRLAQRPMRVVYASSASVYGDATVLPCRDDQPLAEPPLSPYALQKLNMEHYADLYARLHHIPSLGLRYFNAYGDRQDPASPYSGVISRYMEFYQSKAPLIVFGDGQQSRDFIHVEDIALANVRALDSMFAGVLNVATGQPQTLMQLIDCIQKAGGETAQVLMSEPRVGDIRVSYASTEMATKHLGFTSGKSLADGIKQMMVQKNCTI